MMHHASSQPPGRPCDPAAYSLEGDHRHWFNNITSVADHRVFQSFVSDMIDTDFPTGIIVILRNGQRVIVRKRETYR